jgi:hypothetical protein
MKRSEGKPLMIPQTSINVVNNGNAKTPAATRGNDQQPKQING